ncbi:cytochrome P450 [Schizophyllum amplum]|uniref:Cytochrome P450 n=1 Tax=Schizophyllum amplum TaxID=97359 RepID=A0A550CFS1_9AGAR|nr:cytochrome P450 [Auriculariopsis ampla]
MISSTLPPLPTLAGVISIAFVLVKYLRKDKAYPLPPGPKGWPLIGNILDWPRAQEWFTFMNWSQQHNSDLLYVNTVGTDVLIINSNKVAQDLFEKQSSIFSDRPRMPMLLELVGFGWDFSFMPYGRRWRELRKAFVRQFHPPALFNYHPTILQGTRELLVDFLDRPDEFIRHLRYASGAIILRVCYGYKALPENDPFVARAQRALNAMAATGIHGAYLVDSLPFLKALPSWVPGAGFKREAAEWNDDASRFHKYPVEYVQESMEKGTAEPCIASEHLEKCRTPEELEGLRAILGVAYEAGADTTVSALSTFVLMMATYPEVQRKGQEAVDAAFGTGHLPDFSDDVAVPYVDAIIKEVLRYRPVAPLGLSHRLMEDHIYDGYFLPKGSVVIGNAWAMLHEESEWGAEPGVFRPERHLKDGVLYPPAKSPYGTFGFGRRTCAGVEFAMDQMWLTITSILACFDITPIEGETLTGEYTSGMQIFPVDFKCDIKPRSAAVERLLRDGVDTGRA